jgi:hypothetical protein
VDERIKEGVVGKTLSNPFCPSKRFEPKERKKSEKETLSSGQYCKTFCDCN